MKDLIQLDNGEYAISADYIDQDILDYRGNPLIEALPSLLSLEQAYTQLKYSPEYNEKESDLSASSSISFAYKIN